MDKIGLFGGTFDPIHRGHVHIARAVAEELALQAVVLIPAGDPYHKAAPTRTPAVQRLAMVELALAEAPYLAASDCDLRRTGATYTWDTVQRFRQAYPRAQLWWLLGMDSLLHIHTWHRYRDLLAAVNVAVAPRGEAGLPEINPALQDWLPQALAKARQQPHGADGGRLHVLQTNWLPVSSSAIRQAYARGEVKAAAADLSPAVAAYIARHRLYAATAANHGDHA